MFTARENRVLDLREASGTYLVKTRGAWYTIIATNDPNQIVTISGGSPDRPTEAVRIDDNSIVIGRLMSFDEGIKGHSTPVRSIIDVTGMSQSEINALKQAYR